MVSEIAGLFIKPLAEEFHLSRTAIAAILLLSPLGGDLRAERRAVARPLRRAPGTAAGHPRLRRGQRRMLLVRELWQYVLLATGVSACIAVHCYSSYTKMLALWFGRNRRAVTGLVIACGSGAGAVVNPQLVHPRIAEHGWRYAYGAIALIFLLWTFPILFLFLREPGRRIANDASPLPTVEGATRTEASCTRAFSTIAGAMYLAPLTIVGTLAYLFPMLTERGVAPGTAATPLSFIYVGGMIGQLSSGWLLDRVNGPRIVLPYLAQRSPAY